MDKTSAMQATGRYANRPLLNDSIVRQTPAWQPISHWYKPVFSPSRLDIYIKQPYSKIHLQPADLRQARSTEPPHDKFSPK